MSAINPEGLESSLTDRSTVSETIESFIDSTAELVESLDAPESVVSDFEESGRGLAHLVDEIAQESAQAQERAREAEARVDDLEDRLDELEGQLDEHQEHSARDRAETKQRVTAVEETLESASVEANPTPQAEETTIQPDDLTPVEQLSRADDISDVTDSPSVERAVTIFKNLPDWGRRSPRGYVLRPADNPVSLLESACDESLCWRQWYRACETLEELSRGSVTFFDSDRHGKMICLHEQSDTYERVTSGSLSPSTVGGTA
jgi:DNA repair exonuclease SbcCD ATPase subunit